MKKVFVIAALAIISLAACTKIENDSAQKEINFQVANRVQTKAASAAEYTGGAFGTYAWFNGTDDFMVNEKVDKAGGMWKTVDHTFYWPKTGSIDFISYSPFDGASNVASAMPVVDKNSITYTGYTVSNVDLMYADKVTCSSNVDELTDDLETGSDNGYTGVPTLFRHALAKVNFKVAANFLEWGSGSDKTSWEVTLKSAKIGGLYTTGDCALTWSGSEWTKPAGNVWSNPSGSTADQELVSSPVTLKAYPETTDLASVDGFVLPQALTSAVQTIDFEFHIKTTLANGKVIEEDFNTTVDVSGLALDKWEMNQMINYTIKFKPTASDTTVPGSTPDSPEDVTITFDPAVADWVRVDATATIQL